MSLTTHKWIAGTICVVVSIILIIYGVNEINEIKSNTVGSYNNNYDSDDYKNNYDSDDYKNDMNDWYANQAAGKDYNYDDGGSYYCMGKNDTCSRKTNNAYDLYCNSCDPDGDNVEG